MAQFKAIVPGVEVCGAAVLSVVEGMEEFKPVALDILARHGIHNPTRQSWHRQQDWLDAFRMISERIGPATLKAIGNKIPQTALWPPDIRTIEEALASIDVAYHMNHRGGKIGHYRFEKTRERSGHMLCDNPYPCAFDAGIIKSTAVRFAARDVIVIVNHDLHNPCRQKGADSCTYLISW